MEKLKKERSLLRRLYSTAEKELEKAFADECDDIHALYIFCKDKAEILFRVDDQIKECWFSEEANEDEIYADFVKTDSYKRRWTILFTKYERVFTNPTQKTYEVGSIASEGTTIKSKELCGNTRNKDRRFKLPKIELRKFDGDVKNWISFWGQFRKIHEDVDIDSSDKFQYLIQATEPDSKARQLVESFPPSGENYSKAMEQLKERFARDDLLIETYIRGLLQLVLMRNYNNNITLRDLYDKLTTQLQALESLNVTSDKYASMLLPMVESAIPVEILKIWERTRSSSDGSQLTNLLNFIKKEVESEERIVAAREGFDNIASTSDLLPTASCVVAGEKRDKRPEKIYKAQCCFCNKPNHSSVECFKINRLTLEERKELLKKNGACFICLRKGHSAKTCRNNNKCLVCGRRHAIPMCPELRSQVKEDGKQIGHSNNAEMLLCQRNKTTLLQTVLVQIVYNDKKVVTRALFDSGAQRSYIKRDLTKLLGMKPCNKEMISHYLFGGLQTKQGMHNIFKFRLESLDGQFQLNMAALEKDIICGPLPRLQNTYLINRLRELNIVVNDIGDESTDVGILLGADISGYLITGNIVHLQDSLIAIETKLGWSVQGQIINTHSYINTTYLANFSLTELWDMESLGIKDPVETKNEETKLHESLQFFRNTVLINEEGRYEVHLPWKTGYPEHLVANNKKMSFTRLKNVTKRLEMTGKLENYNKIFKEWVQDGIIEEVPDNEEGLYLPHHAVLKESSTTTPLRPVFDASAKDYEGNSLNSSLERGVNLLEVIPKLLINFRVGEIGITADIQKAFLQISVNSKDRQYLQFLWWKDYREHRELLTYRHKRVVFGVTCSPFLLAATINYHLDSIKDERKPIAEKLKGSFYVDNCVTSVKSQEECTEFITVAKCLMNEGKFNLRDWVTGPCKEGNVFPVLGLMWDNKDDFLYLTPHFSDIDSNNITKRVLLSFSQRIFDPIGFTSPVALIPKLLLQRAWLLKIDWDEKLPDSITKEFLLWLNNLNDISKIKVSRRLTKQSLSKCILSLHVFCDACKNAYAACVFLRSEYNNEVNVQLILAKSRVAPVKQITIPRLELISAVIGVRLYTQVVNALGINCDTYFWSDSEVVLTWIKRDSNWSVFVNNRVKEIRSVTNKDQWHHVPGSSNPADLPSRGCHATKLKKSFWWDGPMWLKTDMNEWPKSMFSVDKDEVNMECKKVIQVTSISDTNHFSNVFTYFSKYTKIIRCIAWIFRFIRNRKFPNNKKSLEITFEDYHEAEMTLFKIIQKERFQDDVSKSIKNLDIFTDSDGLMKVKTRLLLGNEPESFKYPILLPKDHVIIQRLIFHKHCLLQHAGTTTVLSNLREQYWVLGARSIVKNVISKCTVCRRFRCKKAEVPMAPLPENRIKAAKVFEVVGVDMAGPLFLKSGEKCWIAIFTCAIYRAVHLELTMSLSTESFIMALRRFIARRGRVNIIYSDNGTNFVGTYNLLKDLDWNHLQAQSNVLQFQWKFNVPGAPWWGGFWERLIRILKDLLRRMLGKSTLTYVELETLICDCESTMNSRPLTYIFDSSDENLRPLTPSCFLQDIITNDVTDLDEIDGKTLNTRLKYTQTLRLNLRQRFRNEYLSLLVQRKSSKLMTSLKVGDVVLVEAEGKRQFWPLGIIQEIYVGRDGICRAAKVKVKKSILTRPFQKLYPLELAGDNEVNLVTRLHDADTNRLVTRSGRLIKAPKRIDF